LKPLLTSFVRANGRATRLGAIGGLFCVAVAVIAAWPAGVGAQGSGLVTRFELSESAFSPDGDGAQDSTAVFFAISEDSPSLEIVVYGSDSVTVVDTLAAPAARAAGADTVFWAGTDSGGQLVAEGLYLITLSAQGTAERDSAITLPVAVDNTRPSIQILLSEPGIYTPGLMGTPQIYGITFTVSNSSPSFGLPTLEDQLTVQMFDPKDAVVQLDTFITINPAYDGQDGVYELEWNADLMTMVEDGHYRIDLDITDQAGHRASASDRPNVDIEPPDIGYVNIEEGQFLTAVPDSLHGWAWDRNGIDLLSVRYADTLSYGAIADTRVLRDTTFFSVPLADSLAGEGSYKITVRAMDAAAADTGWVSTQPLTFEVDLTAPLPPVLEPFDGTWRSPSFVLRGTWSSGTDAIRIFRNGALVDSVFIVVLQAQGKTTMEQPVTLVPGRNVLTATAVDEALNESGPSNEVRVEFVGESGLFIAAPFGPGDDFYLNLSDAAARATLRIYDLSGEIVVVLVNDFPAQNYSFAWDGKNGSGEDVKKGPLVAVSQAEFDEASDLVFREVFLFDPDKP
jgi:flagellar hook assembly protein FlgD